MINKNLLFGKIIENGLTNFVVAEEIGITPHAFSGKSNGKTDFKQSEIKKLIELLNLTPGDVMDIFFN